MFLAFHLYPYLESLIRIFYPSCCAGCSKFLSIQEQLLCLDCHALLESKHLPLLNQFEVSKPEGIRVAWHLYDYEGLVRHLITEFKYSSKRQVLKIFRPSLNEACRVLSQFQKYDAIIPAPQDPEREGDRDYSPIDLIAREISKNMSVPFHSILRKNRATPPQSELGLEERSFNLVKAFEVTSLKFIAQKVLLVDDIRTTGATARELSETLKSAGVKHVDLLTLAKTKGPS